MLARVLSRIRLPCFTCQFCQCLQSLDVTCQFEYAYALRFSDDLDSHPLQLVLI